ncbi:Vacuolar protein sorting-associated protein 13D [Strongyloides ratti]|uniref:Vacuolar protein sorting-associated protein 13D n=1 Tax=Strongyloides ratti TaxID=34506 RepID=A0A090LCV8_STRRB|nr:Vacuolar protein sorting-associated protein 13D [Strongyloides ratti]CEF67616.1 Vacuolar protein sorting-associated protein 13D [Strongyloides ratti]
MLEGLLALVLNRYVGEYLDDINTDNLSIALLSGQVELENVPLKKSALSKLELPLSLKSGVVGKLTLTIPITSLRSEPWIVKLSDVLILLESSFDYYDEEYLERCEIERKEKLLLELEELHKKAILKRINYSSFDDSEKNQWWGASMITSIVNNIHLIIDNVHIRYEDCQTLPVPFNCGIRIQNITVNTANSQWKTGFVNNDNDNFSFKKLNIKGVSIYWNGHDQIISDVTCVDQLRDLLLPQNYKNNCNVIKSFGLQMRMSKNLSKLPLFHEDTPRFKIDIRPTKLDVEMTTLQLYQFRALSKEWARIDRAKNFRKWRPSVSIKDDPAKWWKFAILCVKEPISKVISRNTMKYAYNRAKLVNQYVRTYEKRLICFLKNKIKKMPEMTEILLKHLTILETVIEDTEKASDTAFIKQIERGNEISYYELSILRDVLAKRIMNVIDKDIEKISFENIVKGKDDEFEELIAKPKNDDVVEDPTSTTSNIYDWLTSWISGASKNGELLEDEDNKFFDKEEDFSSIKSHILPPNLKKVEQQVEQELFDALNETWDDTAIFTRDKVLANLTIQIDRIILRIINENKMNDIPASRCLTMDMSNVSSKVSFSARERKTNVLLTTDNFNIQCTKVTSLLHENTISEVDNMSCASFEEDIDKQNHDMLYPNEGNDTILGLFGETTSIDVAQVMFAIGRSSYGMRCDQETETKSPIIVMSYSRFAPKSTVFHKFNAELEPISVTYDESAIDDLYSMFGIKKDDEMNGKEIIENDGPKQDEFKIRENNFYCHFKIPIVEVELKTKRKNLFNDEGDSDVGESFATLMMEGVNIGLAKTEQFITKYKFSVQTMCLRDMYDNKFDKILEIQKNNGLKFVKPISKSNPTLYSTTTIEKRNSSFNDLRIKEYNNDMFDKKITEKNKYFNRKISGCVSSDFEMSETDQLLLSITYINRKHPQFLTKYKEIEFNIDTQISDAIVGMNRRSWILIQDFIGLIPKIPKDKFNFDKQDIDLFTKFLEQSGLDTDKTVKVTEKYLSKVIDICKPSSNMKINISMDTLKIFMNFPRANTYLGSIDLDDVNLCINFDRNNDKTPMLMNVSLSKLLVNSNTCSYSYLYPNIISICNMGNDGTKNGINFTIEKNRTTDLSLERPYDMAISMNVDKNYRFAYFHIQRFLITFSDFWTNFLDLQEQITKKRLVNIDEIGECKLKGRISLNLNINCEVNIILPLNQYSTQCMILQSTSLLLSNKFELASKTNFYDEYVIEKNAMQDGADCLLDNMEILLQNLKIYEGRRVPKNSNKTCLPLFFFKESEIEVLSKSILGKDYDLRVLFSRNLSNFISRNVPNMSAVLFFKDIDITFTTEFYKLLRGFLDKNLGDSIIQDPDTIPLECLLRPAQDIDAEQLKSFINFSFRIQFDNVNLHLLTPIKNSYDYENLGTLVFNDVLLSFDSYVENHSELNLVCYSILLQDSRNNSSNEKENFFKNTLLSKYQNSKSKSVFTEIHVLMKKDEAPKVTFVLQKIRILCILDWYINIKDFILLTTDFVLPTEQEVSMSKEFNSLFDNQEMPINKNVSVMVHERKHTISLKLQLTDTDFIFFENNSDPKSLSLILSYTGSLYLDDINGQLNVKLEVMNTQLSWSIFMSEKDTICLISTPMKFSVELGCETSKLTLTEKVASLIAGIRLEEKLPKHVCTCYVKESSFRLSYKDALVVNSVVSGTIENFKKLSNHEHWKPLPNNNPTAFNSTKIKKIQINISQFSFWFLDDFKGPAVSIMRICASNTIIEKIYNDFNCKGSISMEYYNSKLGDWEQLLNPVIIDSLTITQPKNEKKIINIKIDKDSPLDFNITTSFIHLCNTLSKKFPYMIKTIDENFKTWCRRGRTNQVSYSFKNDTGCDIAFTYQVDKIHSKDSTLQKSVKWFHVGVDKNVLFTLPISRSHLYDTVNTNQNKLAIFIDGYEELPIISLESIKMFTVYGKRKNNSKFKNGGYKTKIIISITMDTDGRKSISIRSQFSIINYLTVPFMLRIDNTDYGEIEWKKVRIESQTNYYVPLNYVNARIYGRSLLDDTEILPNKISEYIIIDLKDEYFSKLYQEPILKKYKHSNGEISYAYISSKQDDKVYLYKNIPGQIITIFSPLIIRNQLPTDVQCLVNNKNYLCKSSKNISMVDVNINEIIEIKFMTEKLVSIKPININKENIKKENDEKSLIISMEDEQGRQLDIYANIFLAKSGSIVIVIWVTYWVVNKSGIPLIVKKRGSSSDVAGQLPEHEYAKDKNPLILSFKDDEEIKKCKVRIGNKFAPNKEYISEYSNSFKLTPGEHSLTLFLRHPNEPTLIYNIGVEISQGTGKYKNTQVIIFTPRYLLINRSSHKIHVTHSDDIYSKDKVILDSTSNVIWNESFEDNKMICVRRDDVKYWSQPFKINQVDSFHVNMRAYDETPNFIRVEITLNNARFCITFTDTDLYPPPIQIINDSHIPVLYYQQMETSIPSYLRSICKAHSKIDYSWDNLCGKKFLTLQASSFQSNTYDLSKPTFGPPLNYENYSYIFLKSTIQYNDNNSKTIASMKGRVMTIVENNRVRLISIKKNLPDCTQLWNITDEGYIENVSLKTIENDAPVSYVLDVNKDSTNYELFINRKDLSRKKTQLWKFDKDGRIRCGLIDYYIKRNDKNYLYLEKSCEISLLDENDSEFIHIFQKEGDGILNVISNYEGPTLVVRISDYNSRKNSEIISTGNKDSLYDINFYIPKGIGVSLINNSYEELIYGRLCGVYLNVTVKDASYEGTLNVKSIQIDNQIEESQQFHFIYCDSLDERFRDDFYIQNDQDTNLLYYSSSPALKIELNWIPKEHYDCFECLRILFSNININLDELLLWKFFEFIQESTTNDNNLLSDNFNQPPSIDLDCIDVKSARRCYFGTLHLKVGNVSLSINTIPFNGMPKRLRKFKSNFNIQLISFENAIISLPPFKQEHTFETLSFLAESLSKFYISELKTQTFRIIVSLDAFGNPLGLATDIKESFQALVFEGDLTGFVSGFGYGVANSFSKVVASVANGIGTLTYDENHELLRRKAIKSSNETSQNNPLTHLYSGFKGLGVGVIGGITAIASNTAKETQKEGILVGSVKGIGTGVVDTFTKPIQGVFDFIGGTALAMKEIAGSGYMKKSNIPTVRLRPQGHHQRFQNSELKTRLFTHNNNPGII